MADIALAVAALLAGAFLLILLILLLVTPLSLAASLEKKGTVLSATGRLGWGWMGVAITWEQGEGFLSLQAGNRSILRRPFPGGDREPEEKVSSKESRTRWNPGVLVSELPWLLGHLVRHMHLRHVTCDLRLGCRSAPITGMIYGYFQAVRGILTPISCVSLSMTPDFDRPVLDGTAELVLEIRYPLLLGVRVLPAVLPGMRRRE